MAETIEDDHEARGVVIAFPPQLGSRERGARRRTREARDHREVALQSLYTIYRITTDDRVRGYARSTIAALAEEERAHGPNGRGPF